MKLPQTVHIGIAIADIIERADAEYVPTRAFTLYIRCQKGTLKAVLFRMKKAGLLEGKMGPSGGYKLARSFTLFQLMEAVSLKTNPRDDIIAVSQRVQSAIAKIDEILERCIIHAV
jgi:DNA-binding IscR family transcriptional regulator